MLTIVLFLLVLSFLVLIHELGHFLTARYFKVKIEEFGLGYPPRALTLFTWKGIPVTLNWLPFGGFVKMEGEDESQAPAAAAKPKKKTKVVDELGPFYSKPRLPRLIILLAGATVNFIFGVLAFTVIFSTVGIPVITGSPIVAEALPGPAQTAGIKAGDVIFAAGKTGEPLHSTGRLSEFVRWISHQADQDMVLQVQREGQTQNITVHTRSRRDIAGGKGALGVALNQPTKLTFYPWYEMPVRSAAEGIYQSWDFSLTILDSLRTMAENTLVFGRVPTDVAGPIGIAREAQKEKIFSAGWLVVLNFMAILSINLAIMNVLPIPALDGGRAFFILLETVVGRKRIAKVEGYVNSIGFVALLILILLISAKDLWSIFH